MQISNYGYPRGFAPYFVIIVVAVIFVAVIVVYFLCFANANLASNEEPLQTGIWVKALSLTACCLSLLS